LGFNISIFNASIVKFTEFYLQLFFKKNAVLSGTFFWSK
jgi:hypothetical protein